MSRLPTCCKQPLTRVRTLSDGRTDSFDVFSLLTFGLLTIQAPNFGCVNANLINVQLGVTIVSLSGRTCAGRHRGRGPKRLDTERPGPAQFGFARSGVRTIRPPAIRGPDAPGARALSCPPALRAPYGTQGGDRTVKTVGTSGPATAPVRYRRGGTRTPGTVPAELCRRR